MKTITVTVNVNEQSRNAKNQSSDFSDPRERFWDAYRRSCDPDSRDRDFESIRDYANRNEQLIKNRLPRQLHYRMIEALLGPYDFPNRVSRRLLVESKIFSKSVRSGQLLVTVSEIRYGSLKIDLGLPGIDAFAELIGNNSDAFEAVFGAYLPDALNSCLPGNLDALDFRVAIPSDTRDYINSSQKKKSALKTLSPKEKGNELVTAVLKSPLIFPILLICFLWYYARQDMVEERRINAGLIQTLVTEQTAVLSLLKDKQDDDKKYAADTTRGSVSDVVKSASPSGGK